MKQWVVFIVVAGMSSLLIAGETGKIAGRVTEKQNGTPLVGAYVMVVAVWSGEREMVLDSPMGTATDANGDFFIINVSPGLYSVRASYTGYKKEIRTRVRVVVDRTTTLNFALETQPISGEEMVVTAYRPNKVEIDLTATKQTYDITEIQSLAGVSDITDILQLQADVVDDHFRGGRVGESLYLIGGANIVNPLNNQRAFSPIVTGIEQVEVYTSGFSAEYGNAQSGVINMVTKEGRDKWETRAEISSTMPYYKTWDGSVYSPQNLFFFDMLNNPEEWLKENPINPGKPLWDVGYGSAGYLTPNIANNRIDSLKIGEIGRTMWLQSVRDVGLDYKNVLDYRLDFTTGGPIGKNARFFIASRQDIVHPIVPTPDNDMERQLMTNITFQPSNSHKFKLSYIYNHQFENNLGSQFLYWTFDRTLSVAKQLNTTHQYGLDWLYVIHPAIFLDLKFKVLDIKQEDRVELLGDAQFTEDYSLHRNWVDYTGPSSDRVGAIRDDRGTQKTVSYEIRSSLTSQVNKNNLFKLGTQLSVYDSRVDMDINASNPGSYRKQKFASRPFEGAVYLQDKMEFQGLIANLGLRWDFYNFNTEYYADEYSPLRNPQYDPTKPYLERGKYYDPMQAQKAKTNLYSRLQPRIGISFPISENAVFHLNYGTFTQRPNFNQVYYNQITMFNQIEVLGNPRLRPENTKAYDVGLVHSLPYGLYLDVSAYYKDVTNLVEAAYFFDEQQAVYQTYRNRDYADIKGFHVNLERQVGFVRGYIRYNYESATGKSSNDLDAPVSYFERPAQGQENVELPEAEDVFLDYDRTHKAVFNLRFRTGKTSGFSIAGFRPFTDMSLSTTLRIMTGRPYTWDESGKGLKFNKRTPTEKDLRIRLEKGFRSKGTIVTAYAEAFNVLNDRVYHYTRTFRDERNTVKWEKDRQNIAVYTVYPPYYTSQAAYIYSNEPRHYRMGLIFNF